MAVKWAVANGNWADGTTWNDGVVPTSEDIVYCNGHNISINWGTIIVKELHNDTNSDLGIVAGGKLQLPASNGIFNFTGDIYAEGTIITSNLSQSRINYINITGNINNHNSNTWAVICNRSSNNAPSSITVNGDIYGNYVLECYWGNYITINGQITPDNKSNPIVYFLVAGGGSIAGTLIYNGNVADFYLVYTNVATITRLTIGGYVIEENNRMVDSNVTRLTDLTIKGNYSNRRAQFYNTTDFTFGGTLLEYVGSNNKLGVNYANINILRPSEFVWKDLAEPRSNPFIILTDAEMNNRQQYPSEDEVKQGTEYVWGEKVGTYQAPPEAVVLKDYVYDNGDKVGSLENQNIVGCVTKEDVREGVPLLGMGENGTLVVPSADDVREGVVFDNGTIGTLIVQGGGDRLRIADFGYYTNAQSDTYIVDLTEQDKPKFAVAEERVLIEMFPDLDLDNIPEKYFDDLFVKYLKYRLIVEYYRTAGINSTFTPSEPTTEIVNYQNVRNEVWLNSANIYLKAWGEKYPNSIKKQRIIL